jgi:hypothetical protein
MSYVPKINVSVQKCWSDIFAEWFLVSYGVAMGWSSGIISVSVGKKDSIPQRDKAAFWLANRFKVADVAIRQQRMSHGVQASTIFNTIQIRVKAKVKETVALVFIAR